MSLLSDAVESLLRDKEIRAALLDFLKGNTPDKRECWREIWRYVDTEKRVIHYNTDPITGIPGDRETEITIIAQYSDSMKVGWIGAYMTRAGQPTFEFWEWITPIYETCLVGTYTEVILHSQTDALTEARAAFALEVERLQNA